MMEMIKKITSVMIAMMIILMTDRNGTFHNDLAFNRFT